MPALLAALIVATASDPNVYTARERDWRNGPVVYHVFVDRFAPSATLEAKRDLYKEPRKLRSWSESPKAGTLNRTVGLWSHELEFWGGDLRSLRGKLSHIRDLGADVLYLNPIFDALTNHKYDALDYMRIAPEYGTRDDLRALTTDLHQHGMRLVLDGVFNHMGRNAPRFQEALADPKSPYRKWFFVGPEYPLGYRAWVNVANLPELRIESPELRKYLWGDADSVVRSYLRDGIDGWRLDTAFELGPKYLSELTRAAHKEKPGSAIVGEAWNYPEGWFPALDGIMNFHQAKIVLGYAKGTIAGPTAARMVEQMVADCGIEPLLKSWVVLDNHDTERLPHQLPNFADRRIARALQFTLPGSPVVYYGSELGQTGGGDPENRAPMRWDLVTPDNPELLWTRKLLAMRKKQRALRVGDFRRLESERLMAFMRSTDNVGETCVVLANPTDHEVKDLIPLRDGRIMNGGVLNDQLSDASVTAFSGMLEVTIPPKTIRVFTPAIQPKDGYTPYKRIGGTPDSAI